MMNVKDVNPSYKIYETMHGRSGALFTVIALGLLILSVTRGLFVIGLGGLVETSMIYNVIFLFLILLEKIFCILFTNKILRFLLELITDLIIDKFVLFLR